MDHSRSLFISSFRHITCGLGLCSLLYLVHHMTILLCENMLRHLALVLTGQVNQFLPLATTASRFSHPLLPSVALLVHQYLARSLINPLSYTQLPLTSMLGKKIYQTPPSHHSISFGHINPLPP